MTKMAVTAPPLLRLFTRLDFVSPPDREMFALLFEEWSAAAGGGPLPRSTGLTKAPNTLRWGFVYDLIGQARDYVLSQGEAVAEKILGALGPDKRLSQCQNRRMAVRLRRLFEECRRTAAPFVAHFVARDRGRDSATVELFVAPLSDDGKRVTAFLVAAAEQPYRTAASAFAPAKAPPHEVSLFALGGDRVFGEAVARILGVDLAPYEERSFEDGEFKIRSLTNVRNRDVYVLSSLHGEKGLSGSDKLCRLLFFLGALKDAGAGRITAVAPYLCYQRKDRQTKPRDPITTRYVAQLLEAMGTDRVIAVDAHNVSAFQNAFRCDTEHLDAQTAFARHVIASVGDAAVAVVSPDLGGEKRAELFRERLERMLERPVKKAFMDKRRSEGKVVGDVFAGDVEGCIAIVLDDLISGGNTMARVARACRKNGAKQVWCAATHGVFSEGAAVTLAEAPIDRIAISDTIPLPSFMESAQLRARLTIVSVAPLIAQAIKRCHDGGSVTELLEHGAW